MSRLIICVCVAMLLLGFGNQSQGQSFVKRYLRYVLQDTTSSAEPKFIAYPTLAYAPETSFEFGVSSVLVYRAKRDTANRLSEVSSFSFITLENQFGGFIDHAIYTHRDRFFFLGLIKYQNFPLSYFDIGPNTAPNVTATIAASEFRFRERVLVKLLPSLYTGPEVDFELMRNVRFDVEDLNSFVYPMGRDGFLDLSLGWGLLYDNRHNVLNVRDGLFAEIAWLTSQQQWGSTFSFNSLFSDLRVYRPVGKHNVFAFQLYGQFTEGTVPFNQLALMGGERLMRGYYLGRYRDKNLIASQCEFRVLPLPFAKRWGVSAFASAGQVSPDLNGFQLNRIRIAGGLGPRFLLFPKKDIYTRFDLAFTPEGYGLYFFIGEAF